MKIQTTKQFERARKKYLKKHYPVEEIADCVEAIISKDTTFLRQHKDHSIGKVREIHINRQYNDDWLLIYQIHNNEMILLLVNLGNHDSLNRIIK